MKLAVVIPILDEEDGLPELSRRLAAALDGIEGADWRVIYVDDGSTDRTPDVVLAQHRANPRFTLIQLSRNFGREAAMAAGFAHADADAVIVMDGDLQDPPEVIPRLVERWRAGGQVVRAHRRSRAETGLRRIGLDAFHRMFAAISDLDIPAGSGGFCLLDRVAVEQLRLMPEQNRYFPGLRWWIGFDQAVVEYDRQDRAQGEPKQTLRRLVAYASDAVFSFSYRPLRLMTAAGACVAALGFALAAYFIAKRLLGIEQSQMGFTTLVSLVLFMGGIQLVAIGLVGEYLGRVYDEVKRRPPYVVRRIEGLAGPAGPRASA